VVTDAQGVPLACEVTAANRHDVTQLIPLVDKIPPLAGQPGRPRCRPKVVQGDRAYDSRRHRQQLRERHIRPQLARRNAPHGSGLGKTRWPVERTLAWLHRFRRLRTRYDRRVDIHEAFLTLACCLVCFNTFIMSG
jgi:transposase